SKKLDTVRVRKPPGGANAVLSAVEPALDKLKPPADLLAGNPVFAGNLGDRSPLKVVGDGEFTVELVEGAPGIGQRAGQRGGEALFEAGELARDGAVADAAQFRDGAHG